MATKKPVIIYGGSGYTGLLIAEFIRDQNIPFIAAGRSGKKIEDAMTRVPGIETADYEVAQVDHTVEALTELFTGAKVVCNTVGPFDILGETVLKACLNAEVHYIDTSGEQGWIRKVRDEYGDQFAEKGLLAGPSVAYMHTVCEIAGEICKEYTDIDTLEFSCIPCGVPTVASTQTIFDMLRQEPFFLEQGELVPWPNAAFPNEVVVPNASATVLCLPWGGSGPPIWYQNDSKIRNAKIVTGFTNRALMQGVVDLFQHYEANLKDLSKKEKINALSQLASQQQPDAPPRENALIHRCFDRCIGSGGLNQVTVSIYSTRGYQQTGLLQAVAVNLLLKGHLKAPGFRSGCQAFGHEVLLSALKGYGLARVSIEES